MRILLYIKLILKTFLYLLFCFFYKRKYIGVCENAYHDFDGLFSCLRDKNIACIKLKKSGNILESLHNLKSMSQSKIILTNISHKDLSQVLIRNGLIVIFICHGGGVYKKMGYAASSKENFLEKFRLWRIHGRYDYVVSTSVHIHDYLAKNYHIRKESILALGSPRTDYFFERGSVSPGGGKTETMVLYAPTYRQGENGRSVPSFLPQMAEAFRSLENTRILFRAHPTVEKYAIPPGWTDVTHENYFEVLEKSDLLVTDYSSVLFDFSYYRRPIFLFIPDEDTFRHRERDLWISPDELAGGNACRTLEELCLAVRGGQNQTNNIWQRFMDACDGHSSERIADFLLSLSRQNRGKGAKDFNR